MRTLLLLFAAVLLVPTARAQEAGCERDPRDFTDAYLDVNDVRARVLNDGGLFYRGNPYVYEVPKGGGVGPVFAAGLLMGGLVEGELRTAATTYGPWEFWPGPLGEDGRPPADCADYDRIYEITAGDVWQYERTGYVSPRLRDWPHDLGAPVIDGDGVPGNYDLAAGDRPELLGHQNLWWVMNDAGGEHLDTNTPPIGVEVQGTAFAVKSNDPALDQATFYRYRITYRGTAPLEDAYVGLFVDPDLGNFDDDYVGSDSLLGLGYVYNADDFDEGRNGYGYGAAPPAMGFDFVQGPPSASNGRDDDYDGRIDEAGERLGMTAFVYYNGGGGVQGDPDDGPEFYSYMQGRWLDGQPITVGGSGRSFRNEPTTFMYSGDPVTRSFWTEINVDGRGTAITPADRRFMMSSGPFSMQPGETVDVVVAAVWARGSDHLDSVAELRDASRAAQSAWDAGFPLPRVFLAHAPASPSAPLAPADGAGGQPLNPVLRWEASLSATTYFIEVTPEEGAPMHFETDDPHVTIEGLDPATRHRWRVAACNVGGCGPWSDAFAFTTGERAVAYEVKGFTAFLTTANAAGPIVPPTGAASAEAGFPVPRTPGDEQQVGPGVWLLHTPGGRDYERFVGRIRGSWTWDGLVPYDYEMRFTARGSRAAEWNGQSRTPLFDVPFEIWRTGIGTSDDPSDDVRMIPYVLDEDGTAAGDPTGEDIPPFNLLADRDHEVSPDDDDPYTDRLYWFMPKDETPGEAGYRAWVATMDAVATAEAARQVRAELGLPVLWRTVLVSLDGGAVGGRWSDFAVKMPEEGTVLRIVTTKPDTPLPAAPTAGADLTAPLGNVTLRWYGPASRVQVARDAAFTDLAVDVEVAGAASSFVVQHLAAGRYHWRIGTPLGWSAPWTFRVRRAAASPFTRLDPDRPARLSIADIFPNPFGESTTLRVGVPEAGAVTVSVYDVLGRRAAVVFDGHLSVGWHEMTWAAGSAPSGVYHVEVRAASGGRAVRAVTRMR